MPSQYLKFHRKESSRPNLKFELESYIAIFLIFFKSLLQEHLPGICDICWVGDKLFCSTNDGTVYFHKASPNDSINDSEIQTTEFHHPKVFTTQQVFIP
jgi:hypothetical protein